MFNHKHPNKLRRYLLVIIACSLCALAAITFTPKGTEALIYFIGGTLLSITTCSAMALYYGLKVKAQVFSEENFIQYMIHKYFDDFKKIKEVENLYNEVQYCPNIRMPVQDITDFKKNYLALLSIQENVKEEVEYICQRLHNRPPHQAIALSTANMAEIYELKNRYHTLVYQLLISQGKLTSHSQAA